MSEKEKRDLGEWYDANFDEELLEERVAAIDLCFDLNQTRQSEPRETSADPPAINWESRRRSGSYQSF